MDQAQGPHHAPGAIEVGICLRVRVEAAGIEPVDDVLVQIDPGAAASYRELKRLDEPVDPG